MSALGWSLPAGCGALPGEENYAISLLPYLRGICLPEGVEDVVWDEDDRIIEGRKQDGNIDLEWVVVCTCEWNDILSDDVNMSAAAGMYTVNNFWRGA